LKQGDDGCAKCEWDAAICERDNPCKSAKETCGDAKCIPAPFRVCNRAPCPQFDCVCPDGKEFDGASKACKAMSTPCANVKCRGCTAEEDATDGPAGTCCKVCTPKVKTCPTPSDAKPPCAGAKRMKGDDGCDGAFDVCSCCSKNEVCVRDSVHTTDHVFAPLFKCVAKDAPRARCAAEASGASSTKAQCNAKKSQNCEWVTIADMFDGAQCHAMAGSGQVFGACTDPSFCDDVIAALPSFVSVPSTQCPGRICCARPAGSVRPSRDYRANGATLKITVLGSDDEPGFCRSGVTDSSDQCLGPTRIVCDADVSVPCADLHRPGCSTCCAKQVLPLPDMKPIDKPDACPSVCPAECMTPEVRESGKKDKNGCPLCTHEECQAVTSQKSKYGSAVHVVIDARKNNCPAFANCPIACVSQNADGCQICDATRCTANKCAAAPTNCPPECRGVSDEKGCPICDLNLCLLKKGVTPPIGIVLPTACPMDTIATCEKKCGTGYRKDKNNCTLCECDNQPTPSKFTCETGTCPEVDAATNQTTMRCIACVSTTPQQKKCPLTSCPAGARIVKNAQTGCDECFDSTTSTEPCAGNPCPSGELCAEARKACLVAPCPQFTCVKAVERPPSNPYAGKAACPKACVVQCDKVCPHGHILNDCGCPASPCACAPLQYTGGSSDVIPLLDDRKEIEANAATPIEYAPEQKKCPIVPCSLVCEHGFEPDTANPNCNQCKCRKLPSACDSFKSCSLVCSNGAYQSDANGCPVCACAKPVDETDKSHPCNGIQCPPPPCTNPFKVAGSCCPQCDATTTYQAAPSEKVTGCALCGALECVTQKVCTNKELSPCPTEDKFIGCNPKDKTDAQINKENNNLNQAKGCKSSADCVAKLNELVGNDMDTVAAYGPVTCDTTTGLCKRTASYFPIVVRHQPNPDILIKKRAFISKIFGGIAKGITTAVKAVGKVFTTLFKATCSVAHAIVIGAEKIGIGMKITFKFTINKIESLGKVLFNGLKVVGKGVYNITVKIGDITKQIVYFGELVVSRIEAGVVNSVKFGVRVGLAIEHAVVKGVKDVSIRIGRAVVRLADIIVYDAKIIAHDIASVSTKFAHFSVKLGGRIVHLVKVIGEDIEEGIVDIGKCSLFAIERFGAGLVKVTVKVGDKFVDGIVRVGEAIERAAEVTGHAIVKGFIKLEKGIVHVGHVVVCDLKIVASTTVRITVSIGVNVGHFVGDIAKEVATDIKNGVVGLEHVVVHGLEAAAEDIAAGTVHVVVSIGGEIKKIAVKIEHGIEELGELTEEALTKVGHAFVTIGKSIVRAIDCSIHTIEVVSKKSVRVMVRLGYAVEGALIEFEEEVVEAVLRAERAIVIGVEKAAETAVKVTVSLGGKIGSVVINVVDEVVDDLKTIGGKIFRGSRAVVTFCKKIAKKTEGWLVGVTVAIGENVKYFTITLKDDFISAEHAVVTGIEEAEAGFVKVLIKIGSVVTSATQAREGDRGCLAHRRPHAGARWRVRRHVHSPDRQGHCVRHPRWRGRGGGDHRRSRDRRRGRLPRDQGVDPVQGGRYCPRRRALGARNRARDRQRHRVGREGHRARRRLCRVVDCARHPRARDRRHQDWLDHRALRRCRVRSVRGDRQLVQGQRLHWHQLGPVRDPVEQGSSEQRLGRFALRQAHRVGQLQRAVEILARRHVVRADDWHSRAAGERGRRVRRRG